MRRALARIAMCQVLSLCGVLGCTGQLVEPEGSSPARTRTTRTIPISDLRTIRATPTIRTERLRSIRPMPTTAEPDRSLVEARDPKLGR